MKLTKVYTIMISCEDGGALGFPVTETIYDECMTSACLVVGMSNVKCEVTYGALPYGCSPLNDLKDFEERILKYFEAGKPRNHRSDS